MSYWFSTIIVIFCPVIMQNNIYLMRLQKRINANIIAKQTFIYHVPVSLFLVCKAVLHPPLKRKKNTKKNKQENTTTKKTTTRNREVLVSTYVFLLLTVCTIPEMSSWA
jgi:hypothetical protein